jgi:hypothetical protein
MEKHRSRTDLVALPLYHAAQAVPMVNPLISGFAPNGAGPANHAPLFSLAEAAKDPLSKRFIAGTMKHGQFELTGRKRRSQ